MSSLKEIKSRIASVHGTLKITLAMKMVSSAKLHKTQDLLGNMGLYRTELMKILASLLRDARADSPFLRQGTSDRVALVCLSSNSSLCGAFNHNVSQLALQEYARLKDEGASAVDVFTLGRRVAEYLSRNSVKISADYSNLMVKPSYSDISALADRLTRDFAEGRFGKVVLVYSHQKSMAVQQPVSEIYLPLTLESKGGDESAEDEFILEPDAGTLLKTLLPKALRIRLYNAVLDSACAEHAARMVAMQTASDNAGNLLQELRLEYNKSRQQKITNEILDIVGGSSAR